MFPAFLDLNVDEIHVEMTSREFAESELIGEIAKRRDVAVGIIDVKNYYIQRSLSGSTPVCKGRSCVCIAATVIKHLQPVAIRRLIQ